MKSIFLTLLTVLICIFVESKNPGFKSRFTLKGLSYANNIAIQILKDKVEQTVIPDLTGKTSGFNYAITNVKVNRFTPPTSAIDIIPGQGLQWTASNGYIAVHGEFRYHKWFIRGSGKFETRVEGSLFNLRFVIGKDSTGRPNIHVGSCSSSIGKVDFRFHGTMAWLYNLFRKRVAKAIKDVLNRQMCKYVTDTINVRADRMLSRISVTTPILNKFLLDYRLSQAPSFQIAYIETYNKGEIKWLEAADVESPLIPAEFVDSGNIDNMLYFWISDYMFNTLAYVAQNHGVLVYTLSDKDIPAGNQSLLNTTCSDFCIGKLIPEIGMKYPNSKVNVRIVSKVAPTMKIAPNDTSSTSSITLSGSFSMLLTVRMANNTEATLLMLDTNMAVTVQVRLYAKRLFACIQNLSAQVKLNASYIGSIDENFLQFIADVVITTVIKPKLNEIGDKGFSLPVIKDFQFASTSLILIQNAILISADVIYTPLADGSWDEIGKPPLFDEGDVAKLINLFQ